MTEEKLAKFRGIFGQEPEPSSIESRGRIYSKLWKLADNFRTAANFGIFRVENAVYSQNQCFDRFHEARRLACEAGYPMIPDTIQGFLEGDHRRYERELRTQSVQATTVQVRKPYRILAIFTQCVGTLAVLVGVFNLFLWFMSGYGSTTFIVFGIILYILGMIGGTKIEVESTRSQ